MDPQSAFTTHSQLYWRRVEDSKDCFESESGLAEPVHIVDIPAAAKLQRSCTLPLRKKECASLKELEDYLGDPTTAQYTSRLM
jgi:hypothetical protein